MRFTTGSMRIGKTARPRVFRFPRLMVYASLEVLSTEIFIAAQARRGIESIEEQPAIGPLCGSKRKFFSHYGIVLVVGPGVWIFEASIRTTSTPVPGYQGPAA